MMSDNLSSAFSHMILAGTGISCLVSYKCGVCFKIPCLTFGIVITHSLLGVWRWAIPEHGETLDTPYQFLGFIKSILALPFVVTEVWLEYGYQTELAYLHSLVAIIPFTLYLADKKSKQEVADIIVAINCESLLIISFLQENYYGIAVAISYMFSHLCVMEGFCDFEDIPVTDLHNYGLALFCYFSLRTLTGI